MARFRNRPPWLSPAATPVQLGVPRARDTRARWAPPRQRAPGDASRESAPAGQTCPSWPGGPSGAQGAAGRCCVAPRPRELCDRGRRRSRRRGSAGPWLGQQHMPAACKCACSRSQQPDAARSCGPRVGACWSPASRGRCAACASSGPACWATLTRVTSLDPRTRTKLLERLEGHLYRANFRQRH